MKKNDPSDRSHVKVLGWQRAVKIFNIANIQRLDNGNKGEEREFIKGGDHVFWGNGGDEKLTWRDMGTTGSWVLKSSESSEEIIATVPISGRYDTTTSFNWKISFGFNSSEKDNSGGMGFTNTVEQNNNANLLKRWIQAKFGNTATTPTSSSVIEFNSPWYEDDSKLETIETQVSVSIRRPTFVENVPPRRSIARHVTPQSEPINKHRWHRRERGNLKPAIPFRQSYKTRKGGRIKQRPESAPVVPTFEPGTVVEIDIADIENFRKKCQDYYRLEPTKKNTQLRRQNSSNDNEIKSNLSTTGKIKETRPPQKSLKKIDNQLSRGITIKLNHCNLTTCSSLDSSLSLIKKKNKSTSVECIYLQGNHFTLEECRGIPNVLRNHINIKKLLRLDLSMSKIKTLPNNFLESFVSLVSLSLHSNLFSEISSLSFLVLSPVSLRVLLLHGCPLEISNRLSYKFYILSVVPQLKNLDHTLLTSSDFEVCSTGGKLQKKTYKNPVDTYTYM